MAPPTRADYNNLFARAQRSADSRLILFQVTKPQFDDLVRRANGRCMVSGILFDMGRYAHGRRKIWAPSLDRINSDLAYTIDNVRLVCIIANIALGDWGYEALMTLTHNMELHREHFVAQEQVPGRTRGELQVYTVREYADLAGVQVRGAELGVAVRKTIQWCVRHEIQVGTVNLPHGTARVDGSMRVQSFPVFTLSTLDTVLGWRNQVNNS